MEVVQLTYIFWAEHNCWTFPFGQLVLSIMLAGWDVSFNYCIKIALFRNQVLDLELVSEEKLNHICSLASFLALYYVEYWCVAPFLADTSVNDLELWKKFNSLKNISPKHQSLLPSKFMKFADAAKTKLNKHLWYLNERKKCGVFIF